MFIGKDRATSWSLEGDRRYQFHDGNCARWCTRSSGPGCRVPNLVAHSGGCGMLPRRSRLQPGNFLRSGTWRCG